VKDPHPAATRSRRGLDPLERLAALTEALGRAGSLDEMCQEALNALGDIVQPDRSAILSFDRDGVMRFMAWHGLSDRYRQATEGHSPWPPDTAEAQPVLVADAEAHPGLEGLHDVISAEGIRSLAFIPLMAGARLLGKFMLYYDRPHRFTQTEVRLAQAVGLRAALAIQRQVTEEELRFQKTVLELQSEASMDGILVVSKEGRMISFNRRFVEMWDIPEEVVQSRSDDAAVESVQDKLAHPEEFRARIAYLYEHPEEDSSDEIRLKDGRIFDRYSGPIIGPDGELFGRAWFFRDVTEARETARRQAFLAEASDVLSSSLDHEDTLRRVARLAVSGIADWCVIYVLDEGGGFRQLDVAHWDQSQFNLVRDLQDRYPPDPTRPGPLRDVLETGTPLLIREVDDAMLEKAARDDDHLRALRELGLRSTIIVPLLAGGATLGAIALGTSESGQLYDEDDLRFAQELARRAATAVENTRLHRAERQAREEAERSAERSARLQAITAGLSRALTATQVGEVIVAQAVLALRADAAAVYALSEDQTAFELLATLGYPDELRDQWGRFPASMQGPAFDAINSGELVIVGSSEELVARWPHLAEAQSQTGDQATVAAPLIQHGRPLGVVYLVFRHRRTFSEEDRQFLSTLARQCAQSVERARLYELEHRTAEVLQRSLLQERLPEIEGITLSARYLPAGSGAQVGGDWFDVISLADGRVGLVVGDVEGRGIGAASAMGQLRNVLRAYAVESSSPSDVVRRVNIFDTALDEPHFATLIYLIFDPRSATLRFSSAGHPPPLVLRPDGTPEYLEGGRSVPIGAYPDAEYVEETTTLEGGSTLLLYTDGLVERRGSTLTEGFEVLARSVADSTGALSPLMDRVLATVPAEERSDDIALLAVRLEPSPDRLRLRLDAEPSAIPQMRAAIRQWLARHGTSPEATQSVLVACGEACTNAILHPRDPDPPVIELEADVVDGTVHITVRDFGSWRAPGSQPERGRGLGLMRAFMESVEVVRGPGGTEVRMHRRLREPSPQ
jgi:GAF domain-containing protein/anti-sigma regulatory factor (Ser/Thr protein kinase)